MKTVRRLALLAGLLLLAACTSGPGADEAQIRDRILAIRDAIRAKQPEGIVRWGTPDWTFTGPDGKDFDRADYLVRARGLFERIVTLDSLETTIDRVGVKGDTAEAEITQVMERHERDPANGRVLHLRLRYREHHDWVKTGDGWRVRRVRFLGAPERTELP